VFANSGQICIAGSRLFVERSVHDEFVERLAAYAKGLRIGDGIDPATEIGPLVSEKQLQRVASYLQAGTAEGATVFAGVSDDMRIAREEIFGPVISALPFDTLDEAVERANNTPYGLAAGVFTRNIATAHQLSRKIRAGSVWVNTYHAIDPAVPFGGYKMSGYGREGGAEHLDEYLNTKGVFIKID
ncbi:MAG: aldehyde dehydrogenase family protein, partial [Mesorhizobium sp.]